MCLECGHAGCSREASLGPALGGGHALHHHVTSSRCKGACVLDVVSKHLHCYECDDYVLADPPWLGVLRSKLEGLVPAPPALREPDDTPNTPVEPGHTGLVNLGNTCFMNSTIQLLANLSGFCAFFRDFLKAAGDVSVGSVGLARQTTCAWLPQLEAKGKPKTFELTHAMHGLLRVLRAGKCRSMRPQLLVQSVWAHAGGLFAPYVQCCASEFLTYVLDRLTLELGAHAGRVVHDLFAVEMEYSTKCSTCARVSTRRERNHDLHVTLPEDESVEAGGLQKLLLNQLGHSEPIGGYECEGCGGAKRACTRVARLVSHPPVLLLTIKRTRYNPRTRRVYKDYRPVSFPPALPLSTLPVVGPGGGSDDGGGEGGGDGSDGAAPAPHYRLASVIVHSSAPDRRTGRASADNGHYFAYCREEPRSVAEAATGRWLEKNDAKVRVAAEHDVLSHQRGCFVLAYEMVGAARQPPARAEGRAAGSSLGVDAAARPSCVRAGGTAATAPRNGAPAEPPASARRRGSRPRDAGPATAEDGEASREGEARAKEPSPRRTRSRHS